MSAIEPNLFINKMKTERKSLTIYVIVGCFLPGGILVSQVELSKTRSGGTLDNQNVFHDKKIVCYFGSWSVSRIGFDIVKDIDPNICTHIIYAFVSFDENGILTEKDAGTSVF